MKVSEHKGFVLVVDDEVGVGEMIETYLSEQGFKVIYSSEGQEAVEIAKKQQPDLVILDLMMPGMDGLEVCRQLRSDPVTQQIIIIMLSAKADETDIVVGLELGAKDYITKPVRPRVLLARIEAALRMRDEIINRKDAESISHYGISVHIGRRKVFVDGRSVELTATEFEMLFFLIKRPGWVFSRSQIVEAVRGDDASVFDRTIDVHLVSLRKKLGQYGQFIETVRGIGYKLRE
ncbi:MAG: response regulator transcription factor [Calditrichaeota bacterium]|nr:response regulator transcription factor [Calditrichota bacterium]MBT7788742.1 response regulator transcription factor [Calditrichota bacterium]